MSALSHADRLLAMAAEARCRAEGYDGPPGPDRRTDTRPLAATLNADADALEAGAAALSLPTEGVRLESVSSEVEAIILRRLFTNTLDGYTLAASREIADVVAEIYGPQAAKRIEELEAEVALWKQALAAAQNADAEAANVLISRALKAEHQRDEAVGALTVIANASERSETMFGGKMSEITRVFQNITRVSRSALTSIREGCGMAVVRYPVGHVMNPRVRVVPPGKRQAPIRPCEPFPKWEPCQ